jgi:hypothetical protein
VNARPLVQLALYVSQALRHPPSPDPQHVNAADMPVCPPVEPTDNDPITGPEHLLHLEVSGCRAGEEVLTRLKHRLPANVARPVRCRAGCLKYAIVGEQIT